MTNAKSSSRHPVSNSPHPSPQPSAWRVFCAIEIPADIGLTLLEQSRGLQEAFPKVSASWNRDGKFHLTLKFLGNVPQEHVANVSRAAGLAASRISPFQIVVGGTGAFPKHGPPRVLWIGVDDDSGQLSELQRRLEDECALVGFPKEERPFHPHLTLARLRAPRAARELASAHCDLGFAPVKVSVGELIVFRSQQTREGSKYTVISRHLLAP